LSLLDLDCFQEFEGECRRYNNLEATKQKMETCARFCTFLGLHAEDQCAFIVHAMLALTVCGVDMTDSREVFAFALVNINKKWTYLAGLKGSDRCFLAVCHVYIAQSILHDDFVPFSEYHGRCFDAAQYAPKTFFRHLLSTMKKWDNRLHVSSDDLHSGLQALTKGPMGLA
jgi:hypothetical protein